MERNTEEPKSWLESHKMLTDSASVEELAASNTREVMHINLTPEEQELLKNSDLKIEIGPTSYLRDGQRQKEVTISGVIEGKNIVLHCIQARKHSYNGQNNLDANLKLVPENDVDVLPQYEDIYTGEEDGRVLSYEEAKNLWVKYGRVAQTVRTDGRLVDYVNNSKEEESKSA